MQILGTLQIRHMQKQDFRQNPHYFQGLSCLQNIEVWEEDWVTVKFKWNTIISHPRVLPSAETDPEHTGTLCIAGRRKTHDYVHLMLSSHREEAHSNETKMFHLGLGKVKNNLKALTLDLTAPRAKWDFKDRVQTVGTWWRKRIKCVGYYTHAQ